MASVNQSSTDENAALERVRNRLVSSPDDKLPQILSKLLPRLLSRFYDSDSALTNTHLIGILEHLRERILLNPQRILAQIWVNPLVQAISKPTDESKNRRWILQLRYTLPILELAIPSCFNFLPAYLRLLEGIHNVLPILWNHDQDNSGTNTNDRLVDLGEEAGPTENEVSLNQQLQYVWNLASWIVVEQIAMVSKLQPVLDWIRVGDDWDQNNAPNNFKKIQEYQPIEEERFAAGNGVFRILLDAVSFDPVLGGNRVPSFRWEFRRHTETILANFEQRQRNVRHELARQGQSIGRVSRRRNPLAWNEAEVSYWRGLQQCVRSYAIKLYAESPEHENILRVVTGQPKPPHALDLYKAIKPSKMREVDGRKRAKAVLQAKPCCSLNERTALLHIILGDVFANQVLDNHTTKAWRYQDLVGGSSFDHPSFVALRPLPSGMAQRAFSHVLQAGLDLNSSQEKIKEDLMLFLALLHEVKTIPSLQVPITTEVYLQIGAKTPPVLCRVIRVLWKLVDHISRGRQDDTQIEYPEALVEHSYKAAVDLLDNLQDIQVQRFQREQRLSTARNHDRRIQEHRDIVANRHPFVKEALEARTEAYQMVTRMVSAVKIVDSDGEISWDLAVKILNCMAFDKSDRTVDALKVAAVSVLSVYQQVLAEYTQHKDAQNRALPPINPLLLPLLKACISASDWCREMVVDWAEHFVSKVDLEISHVIFACLVSDDAPAVARKATGALTRLLIPVSNRLPTAIRPLLFDLERSADRDFVMEDLQNRVLCLTSSPHNLSNTIAYQVLQEFDFAVDKASKALVDGWEPNSVFPIEDKGDKNDIDMDTSEDLICQVCWDVISKEDGFTLRCGHYFCVDCYDGGLQAVASSTSFRELANFTCLRHDCNERMGVEEVSVVAPGLVETMEEAYLNYFILMSSDYAFCPGPDCCAVVRRSGTQKQEQVDCSHCSTSFCFACGDEPHAPVRCGVRRQFLASCDGIKAHEDSVEHKTIPCPGCGVLITKVSGCNHMTCRCGHEFCWICLSANWQDHVCNVYDTLNGVDDLERIQFFRRRVDAHRHSAEETRDLLLRLDEEAQKLQSRSFCQETHIYILKEAWEMLLKGRNFLTNSYIAAYGFPISFNAQKRHEFETLQSQLQLFVEQLSFLSDSLFDVYRSQRQEDFVVRFRGLHFCTIVIGGYIKRVDDGINRLMA